MIAIGGVSMVLGALGILDGRVRGEFPAVCTGGGVDGNCAGPVVGVGASW